MRVYYSSQVEDPTRKEEQSPVPPPQQKQVFLVCESLDSYGPLYEYFRKSIQ